MRLFVTYDELKAMVESGQASLKFLENNQEYHLIAFDGTFGVECYVQKGSADATDFEANLKPAGSVRMQPVFSDGTPKVHATPRSQGFTTVFTGAGDSKSSQIAIGGTTSTDYACWHHEVGDAATQTIYISMNTKANETHVQEGYLSYKDALNDRVTIEFVPKLTAVGAGINTNYTIVDGYLIVPASGNGATTVAFADMVLVERGKDLDNGGLFGQGFWNADFDESTGQWSNVTAAPLGDGLYNMFSSEVVFTRFVNQAHMLGNGTIHARAADKSQHPHNVQLKLTIETLGVDHEWWGNLIWTCYRRATS